jgi:hypothetical protein
MPTEEYMISAFVNAMQQHTTDVERVDIDNNPIGFRASKSYWIDYGWMEERWRDHGLPQITVFQIGGGTVEQDLDERCESAIMQVDIFASGRNQKTRLTREVKGGFFERESRLSLLASGVKLDKVLTEFDTIDDELLPQKVFRKQLTFQVFYYTDEW